ncbi:MAG: amidohydrolase [Flavobacteriales bacterium]|nr:amidohydrolase [Flavobacteriales bacterium]
MQELIRQKSQEILNEVVAIRRHIHQNPELSFQEFETSKFVQSKLGEWGIEFSILSETGVVGFIPSPKEGADCIGLRADMDALPILEQNEVEYKSKNEGVMHACGHDVHTSILLGTAKILKELQAELTSNIKLIFQPGEEKLPGGASLMIAEKVLESPAVDRIYALHVFPEMEKGNIGLKAGMYMASCDEIYLTVKGKGGHAAMPHQNVDPIYGASKMILALQESIKSNKPEDVPCVLAFGRIEGLGATNVIPNEVHIQGTFRTMNEDWRAKAHALIQQKSKEILQEMGGDVDVDIRVGYPYLENDPNLTEKSREILKNQLGTERVHDLPLRMTGEDFAYFSQQIPATFIRLGVRNEAKGIVHPVHNAKFDIDESALSVGVETFLALSLLGR